jgi:hypothetical protein
VYRSPGFSSFLCSLPLQYSGAVAMSFRRGPAVRKGMGWRIREYESYSPTQPVKETTTRNER